MKKRGSISRQELHHLFARAHHGDREAREKIFSLLRGRFLAVAKYKLMEDDVEDAVQEALMVVHEHFSELANVDQLMAFTFGVLRHKIGNIYRRRARRERYRVRLEEAPEPTYYMDGALDAAQLDRLMLQAIQRLGARKPECRAMLLGLREGLSIDDFSRRWRLSRSALDKRLARCRRALRRMLREEYGLHL